MVEDAQVRCPECQTTQAADAPFCVNCGHRIGRDKTVQEGYDAVSDEIIAEARRTRLANDTDDVSAADDASAGRKSHPKPAESKDSQTFYEGLSSIDTEAGSADQSAEVAAASTSTSALMAREAPPSGGRMALYGTIWLSLTVVAVLATYVLATRADDPAAAEPTGASGRLEVAAGSYSRGLDDGVRSFILQMCRRVKDDPGKACKQDVLLRGEYPQTSVEVAGYDIDATEVTVGDYQECVDQGDCAAPDYQACAVWTHQGLQISLRVPKALRRPAKPVVCVTRADARAYCGFAGGHLPSADQWEKAARGGDANLFPWGTSWSSDVANWGEMDIAQNSIVGKLDGFEWTAPPAQFPDGKSPVGAYDMAGNVAEWVAPADQADPNARGGSWTSHPFDLRATHRLILDADDRRTDVGFRCAYR